MTTKRRSDDDPKKPLTQDQIRALTLTICEDDQPKAEALLVLVSDMYERQNATGKGAFPFWTVRQVAFSQCGNDAIDAQVQLLKSELPGGSK